MPPGRSEIPKISGPINQASEIDAGFRAIRPNDVERLWRVRAALTSRTRGRVSVELIPLRLQDLAVLSNPGQGFALVPGRNLARKRLGIGDPDQGAEIRPH
jgi:hypothetical protein